MYFASHVDRATTCCFTEFHVIGSPPMKNICPEVLFLSFISPTKSLFDVALAQDKYRTKT